MGGKAAVVEGGGDGESSSKGHVGAAALGVGEAAVGDWEQL